MNFFINEDTINTVKEALGCNRNLATRELLNQTRRLYTLYSQTPTPKHAKYWSKVDASALYALARNRQLPKEAMDVAITDLERAEAHTAKMDTGTAEVYNDFVYFIQKITRPAKNKDELLEVVKLFVETYTDKQIETLKSYLALNSGNKELDQILKDAVKRVRCSANTKIKSAFRHRVDLVTSFLCEYVQDRAKAETAEPSTTTTTTTTTTTSEVKLK